MKRAVWGVAGMIGVVAVALLAAFVAGGDRPEPVATVAASEATTTSTTLTPVTTTTSTTLAAVTSTTRRVATTTTTPAAPATTAPGTTTTTAGTSGRPGPACAPSMFSATVTMSKAVYDLTEPVQGTSTFRNVSAQTCYWASDMGGFDVLDASGASVVVPAIRISDAFRWVPFPAGDALTETWTWDQRVCRGSSPCTAATPGQYTFVVNLQPYGSGRAPFAITA